MAEVKHKGFTLTYAGYSFYVEHYQDTGGHTSSDSWIIHCDEEKHPRHIVYSVDGLYRVISEHD